MNKKELVEAVALKQGLTKKQTEEVIDSVFDEIVTKLLDGDKVLISGFGTFKVVNRKERRVVSPMNSDEIMIPASKTISFKTSVVLKKDMNE